MSKFKENLIAFFAALGILVISALGLFGIVMWQTVWPYAIATVFAPLILFMLTLLVKDLMK